MRRNGTEQMKHIKTCHQTSVETDMGTIVIEGPVPYERLSSYTFDEQLNAFRKPEEQFKAILEIAQLPEGRIIIARDGDCIVGYATFLYPDPLERWSEGNIENLLELGAIEIAADYRKHSLSKKILEISVMDGALDDYIVITTEYYWHWDLKGSGLNVWQYREVMEKVMGEGGLVWFATDEEDIASHPANCLMVRIGKNVDTETVEAFDKLRFKYRFMY